MRDKYGELVGRVRDREELSDLIAEMVSELSTLCTPSSAEATAQGARTRCSWPSLGALPRARCGGGRLCGAAHLSSRSGSARPSVAAGRGPAWRSREGDVLLAINGSESLSVADPGELLRNQAGKQVLVRVKCKRQDRAARRGGEADQHGGGCRSALLTNGSTRGGSRSRRSRRRKDRLRASARDGRRTTSISGPRNIFRCSRATA